jgi:translation initiation factor 1 (eIF-1/SUI1)
MVLRSEHTTTVGTDSVALTLPDEYEGISTIVGITKLAATGTADREGSIPELLKQGQIIRIRIGYIVGTRRKYATIICNIDKIKTALGSLKNKAFRGGTIRSAYFARRQTLS